MRSTESKVSFTHLHLLLHPKCALQDILLLQGLDKMAPMALSLPVPPQSLSLSKAVCGPLSLVTCTAQCWLPELCYCCRSPQHDQELVKTPGCVKSAKIWVIHLKGQQLVKTWCARGGEELLRWKLWDVTYVKTCGLVILSPFLREMHPTLSGQLGMCVWKSFLGTAYSVCDSPGGQRRLAVSSAGKIIACAWVPLEEAGTFSDVRVFSKSK